MNFSYLETPEKNPKQHLPSVFEHSSPSWLHASPLRLELLWRLLLAARWHVAPFVSIRDTRTWKGPKIILKKLIDNHLLYLEPFNLWASQLKINQSCCMLQRPILYMMSHFSKLPQIAPMQGGPCACRAFLVAAFWTWSHWRVQKLRGKEAFWIYLPGKKACNFIIGDIPWYTQLYKVYMGLIIKGTIPRCPKGTTIFPIILQSSHEAMACMNIFSFCHLLFFDSRPLSISSRTSIQDLHRKGIVQMQTCTNISDIFI